MSSSQNRILPLLGPAAVIYLTADAAGRLDLGPQRMLVASAALALTLAPLWLRHRDAPGVKRVASLGITLGVSLATLLSVHPLILSKIALVVRSVSVPAAGALLFDLALVVPDKPGRLGRLRPVVILGAIVSGGVGLFGTIPSEWLPLGDDGVLLPEASLAKVPVLFGLTAALASLLLRLMRRSLGSGPSALASNAWAVMGLVGAVGVPVIVGALLAAEVFVSREQAILNTGLASALSAQYGHLALVDPKRRLYAGGATRRVVTIGVTSALIVALSLVVKGGLPTAPGALAWVIGVLVAIAFFLERLIAPLLRRAIAPYGGRLLDALVEIDTKLPRAGTLDEVGRVVLTPLRVAAGEPDAQPLLYLADPPREVYIDAAGMAHVRNAPLPASVAEHAADGKGAPIITADLTDHVVRRPALRPLVEVLTEHDALCVLPLVRDDDVEGALFVPRGRRSSLLTLEEINALREFGDRLAAIVSWVAQTARAQGRVGSLSHTRDRGEEENDALREELERLRADAAVLRAGQRAAAHDPQHVAYSAPARALHAQLDQLAKQAGHLTLVAESGAPLAALAARVHRASLREGGPFVMADCASLSADATRRALLGAVATEDEAASPGWLTLASGGTLVLIDVPALSRDAQRELAEVLSVRQVRPIGAVAALSVDVRVIATSRAPIDALVKADAMDAELGRWLSRFCVRVPRLADRREDIPSLGLLAIDRACRRHGRAAVGFDQSAMDLLLSYDWPGDVRELETVVDWALQDVRGEQMTARHLATAMAIGERGRGEEAAADPYAGTWAEIEKRVLENVLARTGGNKSEAARTLGLKRTTFLDKLRRHDVDPAAVA